MPPLHVSFAQGAGPSERWNRWEISRGRIEPSAEGLRLTTVDAQAGEYSNAQLDDYTGLPRRRFLWRPPLTLTVRARFSHPGFSPLDRQEPAAIDPAARLVGTAGFGFWNDPFQFTEKRLPAPPRALWFFYASPPSDMKLDLHTPGWGWKAAAIDAGRLPFFLLLPTAPVAIPLMRLPAAYRRLWPIGQAAIGVAEALLSVDMTAWHTYTIRWEPRRAAFAVDGQEVLATARPPRGPLGLVLWLDNQAMVVTPQGRFRHLVLDRPGRQWLELAELTLE
ncbi:MAG: family 16 glycosylhydrolase [Caldilineales bacterium]|nr:family 16 glycosylhydrolase [Caldilineales bacterium]MDW8317313.1 hypothetical protein [Anaerolineae bacterium]